MRDRNNEVIVVLVALVVLAAIGAMGLSSCRTASLNGAAKPNAAIESDSLQALHEAIATAKLDKAIYFGCLTPARNNERVAANQDVLMSIARTCDRSIAQSEATARALHQSNQQAFVNACIGTSVALGPIPTEAQGPALIEYCTHEADVYLQQFK